MNSNDDLKYNNKRVLISLSAGVEKKILLWLSKKIPKYITPDMLTFMGLFAMVFVGLSYYFTAYHRLFLICANVGIVINWFGDSLDGTIARVRNQSRPKYGYYFDHLVDTFGIFFLVLGLAYSNLVSQPFAWLVLTFFLITSSCLFNSLMSVMVFFV